MLCHREFGKELFTLCHNRLIESLITQTHRVQTAAISGAFQFNRVQNKGSRENDFSTAHHALTLPLHEKGNLGNNYTRISQI